ncbi:MAG TPA: hypothetical protein VF163_16415 [Micromonosporaceae bacterium]
MNVDEQFEGLSPAHVSDALKQVRAGGGVVSGWVGRFAGVFVGVALPVQCVWEDYRAVDPAEYRTSEIESAVFAGAVVVIDSGGRSDAVCGPVALAAYAVRGARAVVVNGGTRPPGAQDEDAEPRLLTRHEVARSGFGSVRRELTDRVVIDGVEIRRGDVMVGDRTAVVIVPAAVADTVARQAAAVAAADEEILTGLRSGASFGALWADSSRNINHVTKE